MTQIYHLILWLIIFVFEVVARPLNAEPVWITGDLYVVSAPEEGKSKTEIRSGFNDCRAQIAKKMCLVDPVKEPWQAKDRPCLKGGESYAKHFEALHDHYPKALQKMFCSLNKIYIEKKFFGTAYAGVHQDPQGKIVKAEMGIRQSVLDENLDLDTWASWKEQLSFGGAVDSYALTPGLPTISSVSLGGVNDFLYFVVAHEFGHIFDFANHLNKSKDPDCSGTGEKECEMAEGSWGALSWLTNRTPRPENELAHRKGLCFYWCQGKSLPKEAIFPVYHGLQATSFLSLYSTTQPWDDFADSLAYYLMAENLGTRYVIDSKQGGRYHITRKLYSERFSEKFRYLEEALRNPNLIYP